MLYSGYYTKLFTAQLSHFSCFLLKGFVWTQLYNWDIQVPCLDGYLYDPRIPLDLCAGITQSPWTWLAHHCVWWFGEYTVYINCLLFIVISAKSTNFTTNTRYHVESSVDEPHRLQQRVLVLVSWSLGVLMSSSSRSPGFLSSSTCSAPSSRIPSLHKSPDVLGSFPHC